MKKPKKPLVRERPRKPKIRRARCARVLAILGNRLETVELVREEEYEAVGDFSDGPIRYAVVRYRDLNVHISLDTVVFLR
jgi:hypothetical protein